VCVQLTDYIMYNVSRIALFTALLFVVPNISLVGQTTSTKDLTPLCSKAGFSIQAKATGFDLYRYQKAFLSFDRLDNFRLEDKQAVYVLENGEASILLASAAEIREKHGKKIDSLGSKQPPIRFVLNVNGQVKEQPLN
jgi:hypothetical protein